MPSVLWVLISVGFTAVLFQPRFTVAWKLRYYKGLLMLGKNRCQDRCTLKHGFFKDLTNEYRPASVAKRYVPKCQCMVSRELRNFIAYKFGIEEAKRYGRRNFIGRTRRAREKLKELAESAPLGSKARGAISFITYDQLQKITAEKRKAAELERQVSAHQAAAAATSGQSKCQGHVGGASGGSSPRAGHSGISSPKAGHSGGSAQSSAVLSSAMSSSSGKVMSPEEAEQMLKAAIRDFNLKEAQAEAARNGSTP